MFVNDGILHKIEDSRLKEKEKSLSYSWIDELYSYMVDVKLLGHFWLQKSSVALDVN